LKEALAMPDGDLKQEAVKAAEDALRDWEQRAAGGTGGAGDRTNVADRVRAHWKQRLREAMGGSATGQMSDADPQLKQQAIEAAEQALKDFEERQKGGTQTADRVRAHWQRRLKEAMDMSDVDPQLKQQAVEAAEQALRDYEQRAKSQEQRAGGARRTEVGGQVPPDWMNRWRKPTPVGPEQMGAGQAAKDGSRRGGSATVQSGLEEMAASAYRAGQALSALVMVAEYVGQIGTAVGQLQAKVSMFELPRAGQGAPYLPQAHG
jgi:hypothetical protein